jgi:hypothetical protein
VGFVVAGGVVVAVDGPGVVVVMVVLAGGVAVGVVGGVVAVVVVVVEDTPTGVRAGIAAGMTVFAFAAAEHADRAGLVQAGGHLFHRMDELASLLQA